MFLHLCSDTLNKSQVDYGATADELEIHFNGCGPVNRVTILCDRFSGHPKGLVLFIFLYLCTDAYRVKISNCFAFFLFVLHSFAYIEFSDRDSVQSAIGLHETLFRGRVLKVIFTELKCSAAVKSLGIHYRNIFLFILLNVFGTSFTTSLVTCKLQTCINKASVGVLTTKDGVVANFFKAALGNFL